VKEREREREYVCVCVCKTVETQPKTELSQERDFCDVILCLTLDMFDEERPVLPPDEPVVIDPKYFVNPKTFHRVQINHCLGHGEKYTTNDPSMFLLFLLLQKNFFFKMKRLANETYNSK